MGDRPCLLLELKLAMVEELTMHYFVRSGAGACEARLTTVADLAIFRLAGPGAGACEAKLYSDRGVFCKGLVRELGVFRRSSLNVPQPPVPFIAGLHRR